MGYWSVYVSRDDDRELKEILNKIAEKKRWSFSQAVAAVLREHLLEEKRRISDEESWNHLAAQAFFEGYSEADEIYDSL